MFGAYVFDRSTGTLRRGRDRLDLQAQPAQLLALLLEHAGENVTREQIRERLWPDTVVGYDQNINFAIRQIRVALNGDANLVQTVPRRGYRFVGELGRCEIERPNMGRMIWVAAGIVATLAVGFSAGIVVRDAPAGRFVYEHLVHPDRCPYVRMLLPIHRNS